MIFLGEKIAEKIYRGHTHVLRIYKGFQLWYVYLVDNYLKTIEKIFSASNAKVTKAVAGRVSAISKLFTGTQSKLNIDAVEKAKAEGKAFSDANAIASTGHTEKIKADDTFISGADVKLTDHKGNIEAEEQQIISMPVVKSGKGYAQPQTAEEQHILFTQSVPTANKGQVMSKPVEQDMQFHIKDNANIGAGHAKAQKAETHGFFSYVKPKMLAQKIMPEMQEIKAFFKNIVSFGSGHARPQQATDNKIFLTAEKSTLDFGFELPKANEIEIHSAEIVSGGVGHARPQSAEAKHLVTDFAQITGETHDVATETRAYSDNVVKFDKAYGKGFEAENGGISGGTGDIYKPKKQLETNNAGGISGADSKVYKPDKLLKTDILIRSGSFAKLFRVVCMSATTTAKLITQPPMFKYVFLGTASGGGISSGTGLLDTATYEELYGWAVQYDNVLYIYQSNTAAQGDDVLSIDNKAVEAWHTQTDNVLYINVSSTAERKETQLEIDMLTQLNTDEWAVQTDNVLLINGIVENTDMEVS